MTQILKHIAQLSFEEKIILAQRIWDDIAENAPSSSMKTSPELMAELKRRYALIKQGKTKLHSWEEAESQILP